MAQQTDGSVSGMPVAPVSNSSKKVWWILAALVLVGIVVYLLMAGSDNSSPATVANSISVSDQNPNTVAVVIDSAELATAGFIVLHQDNNNAPGAIVAQSKVLPAGSYKNQSIIVTTTPGASYWAMLHSDDGNGVFEAAKDQPLTGSNGQPVMIKFRVQEAGLINGEIDIKG